LLIPTTCNEILGTSQRIAIGLVKAESAVRTDRSSDGVVRPKLDRSVLTAIESSLTSLQQLTHDRPLQASQVNELTQIARSRIQLLRQQQLANIDSLSVNRRFWESVERLAEREQQRLQFRTRSLQADRQLHTNLIWGSGGLGTIGTIVALRLLERLSQELGDRQSRLTQSQHLIRAVMAHIIDGVAIVDELGTILSFNHAAVEMFGYPPDEIVGCNWHRLLSPAAEVDLNQLSNPHRLELQQAMGQRKNGDCFPIEFSINPMMDNDALDPLQLERIIIIRDITERQQAAAKFFAQNRQLLALNDVLNITNRSLIESNRELDRFAYITAHDLKAPLRAIASLSEWVEEDLAEQFPTETRSQMQLLRSRVYRLQSLLDSLLEYSRSGRRQNPIVRVDVNELIAEAIQTLAPPETMTIELRTPLPILYTRKQPLQQVFSQLIDNAIRHHPTQVGVVAISARDLGEYHEFTIADDGDGIDPQYHERIYTLFQTLVARDRREHVGVGLAIVKKILAAEGGTIDLDSAVGMGASFKFTWLKQPIVT
jgi:PAS domain S-box-containing protein